MLRKCLAAVADGHILGWCPSCYRLPLQDTSHDCPALPVTLAFSISVLPHARLWTAGLADAAPSPAPAADPAAPSPVAASLLSEALQRSSLNEASAQHDGGNDDTEEDQPAAEAGNTEEAANEGAAADGEEDAAQHAAPTHGNDAVAEAGEGEPQAAEAAPTPEEPASEVKLDEPVSSSMLLLCVSRASILRATAPWQG